MSKSRSKSTPNQLDLALGGAGALAGVLQTAAAQLAVLIRRSRLSREQLVEAVSALLGRRITKAQLDAWTAETNKNRMPADVLIALCAALNDFTPVNTLLGAVHRAVADRKDQAYAEIGRVTHEKLKLDDREAAAWRVIRMKDEGGRMKAEGRERC